MKSKFFFVGLAPVRDAYHLMCDSTVNKPQLDNNTRHNTTHRVDTQKRERRRRLPLTALKGSLCALYINVSENTHMYVTYI